MSLPRSGTASPKPWTMLLKMRRNSERCGSWPSTSSKREMFQDLGTSSSFSMPISRRRASLRLSSASVATKRTCRRAIRSKQHAPSDMHRVVVAAPTAILAQHSSSSRVGDGGEELFDGGQAGAVFQAIPGEQGLGHGDVHGDLLASSGGNRLGPSIHRKLIPAQGEAWSKNRGNFGGNEANRRQLPRKMDGPAGKGFFDRLPMRAISRGYAQRKRLRGAPCTLRFYAAVDW